VRFIDSGGTRRPNCITRVGEIFRVGQRAARPFPERRPASSGERAFVGPRSPTRATVLVRERPRGSLRFSYTAEAALVLPSFSATRPSPRIALPSCSDLRFFGAGGCRHRGEAEGNGEFFWHVPIALSGSKRRCRRLICGDGVASDLLHRGVSADRHDLVGAAPGFGEPGRRLAAIEGS
jgi:hypothetical protein